MSEYQYLFPFEKVAPGSRILIYGAGVVGQHYIKQITITGYCNIIGVVDKSWNNISNLPVPVFPPEKIFNIDFDFLVIAISSGNIVNDIKLYYIREGINESKIVYVGKRSKIRWEIHDVKVCLNKVQSNNEHKYAFNIQKKAIAIRMSSAIGDSIQQKAFFMEIARLFPECKIDLYINGNIKIVNAIYSDQPALNCIINDYGLVAFNANKSKYLLALHIMYLVEVDFVNYELANFLGDRCWYIISTLQNDIRQWGLYPISFDQYRIQCERAIYNGWNCFSLYNYISLFDIKSSYVPIPIDARYEEQAQILHSHYLYITFNYGGGATRTHVSESNDARQWPKSHFSKFIKIFKELYPSISVIQLGDKAAECLNGADEYFLGYDIEIVKHILKKAIFHISSEGGIMHLATQLGTKCITLFGPTQIPFFGYEKNINIKSDKCGDCYFLYESSFTCARHLERPECMWSITPEMVMEKVKEYLKERGYEGVSENVF